MQQHSLHWDPCLEHAALSDLGMRRANNQDAMAMVLAGSEELWRLRGHLLLVADGMGAHAAGELASKLAVDTVALSYFKRLDLPPPEALRSAVREANQQIHGRGETDPEFKGMGTTTTALLLLPQGAVVAHVGDSRAYRLRGNRLEQLTFDHSLVWEMRAASQLPAEEFPNYVPKNIITRSLGPNDSVEVDLEGPLPIAVGDTFLLCSDGLSGPVKDEEIGLILGAMPPAEAVQVLVDLANLRGGPDNITVLIARVTGPAFTGPGTPPTAPPRAAAAQPVHPLLWTALGVFALATFGAAGMGYWATAMACSLGAAMTGILASVLRHRGPNKGTQLDRRPLGKGPYASVVCSASRELVAYLAEVAEELRDAAAREDWTLDWNRFRTLVEQAQAATQLGDHTQALRQYAQAISFMMGQLKLHRRSGDQGALG